MEGYHYRVHLTFSQLANWRVLILIIWLDQALTNVLLRKMTR